MGVGFRVGVARIEGLPEGSYPTSFWGATYFSI